MAQLITTALTYSKEDAAKYFFQPMFVQNPMLSDFDVMYGVNGSFKLQKFASLDKVTKAEAGGFSGQTGAALTQRSIVVARMEAEASQNGGTFYNTIMGEVLRRGLNKDDISGTVLQEIVSSIFMKGTERDLNRQLWFGDTGSIDVDYNVYSGIFKQYASLPAGQKLVGAIGALGTDAAIGAFETMYAAITPELREMWNDVVIEVSASMADNYRETLETKGVSEGFNAIVNGIPSLKWRGASIIVHPEWDTHIVADTLATDTHRAIMHVRKNIAIGTDINEVGGADVWYNKDLKENRFRMEYVIGTNYKNDELAVTYISA